MLLIPSLKHTTKKLGINSLPTASVLYLSLQAYRGDMEPLVDVGSYVRKFEPLAKATGTFASTLHAPVSGTILEIATTAEGTFIFVKAGIRFEYMSFSILLMNGFSERISQVFKPIIWGAGTNYHQKLEAVILLTIHIAIVAAAIIALYYYHLLHYAVYLYLAFIIYKFNYSFSKKIHNYV